MFRKKSQANFGGKYISLSDLTLALTIFGDISGDYCQFSGYFIFFGARREITPQFFYFFFFTDREYWQTADGFLLSVLDLLSVREHVLHVRVGCENGLGTNGF